MSGWLKLLLGRDIGFRSPVPKRELKHWPRNCPNCGTEFLSVQELGRCPDCKLLFKAGKDGVAYPKSYPIRKEDPGLGWVTSFPVDEEHYRSWTIDAYTNGRFVEICGDMEGPQYESAEKILIIASQLPVVEARILDYIRTPSNRVSFRKRMRDFELEGICFHDKSDSTKCSAHCIVELPSRCGLPVASCLGNGDWSAVFAMKSLEVLGVVTDEK